MNPQIVCIGTDDNDYRQIEIDEYNEDQLEEDALDTTTTYERITSNPNIKTSKADSNVYILSSTPTTSNASTHNDASIQHTSARQTKIFTQSQSNSMQNDPDERFLLSCLPILKRLPNKKNALARLKIQQLLFDIEFDEYDVNN